LKKDEEEFRNNKRIQEEISNRTNDAIAEKGKELEKMTMENIAKIQEAADAKIAEQKKATEEANEKLKQETEAK
jgi:ribulose-5-phosphate 4-epimerase/fuculose-1-phosphate aldolase